MSNSFLLIDKEDKDHFQLYQYDCRLSQKGIVSLGAQLTFNLTNQIGQAREGFSAPLKQLILTILDFLKKPVKGVDNLKTLRPSLLNDSFIISQFHPTGLKFKWIFGLVRGR